MNKLLVLLFIPLAFTSCLIDSEDPEDLLPDASGEHGHILILMENEHWESKFGDVLRAQLDQNIEGPFIRSEPMFNFYQKEPGTLTHINKSSRVILKIVMDHDKEYEQTEIIEKHDEYAKGQLFLIIKDSDYDRMYKFLANDFKQIIDLINDFELMALKQKFKDRHHKAIKETFEEKFGCTIYLPRECELKVEKKDFMWVKYDRSRNLMSNEATGAQGGTFWVQEGIIFWSEPYSELAMDPLHILEKRDTILKYNIPGKLKGSWMATEYDPCCAPEAHKINLNGNDCIVFEGNWKHAGNPNAFGGGPFVQYTVHNKTNNTAVTVCGYVYAPKFDKREYIRELHAMLGSIESI